METRCDGAIELRLYLRTDKFDSFGAEIEKLWFYLIHKYTLTCSGPFIGLEGFD